MRPAVAVLNDSSVWNDAAVAAWVAAAQIQVNRDFAPVWGASATLVAIARGQKPPPGCWWLVMLDDADQAGALGYHETTAEGQPLGKVFLRTTLDDGGLPSVTASHELLEMLVDPWIDLLTEPTQANVERALYAREVCDACEDDAYAYDINGISMSDFVLPQWFHTRAPAGSKFDHMGHISQPLELLPGGYIGVYRPGTGWSQVTGDQADRAQYAIHAGSRRDRRQQTEWRASEAWTAPPDGSG